MIKMLAITPSMLSAKTNIQAQSPRGLLHMIGIDTKMIQPNPQQNKIFPK
ncbi:MAG: hypothetical protein MR210_04940 [Erysipelotrichaceae bacterium]|nr:hypothetical protein [Erysipelotrichaceae bacterium]